MDGPADHRGEVHGEKTTAAVAGLEDLCSQRAGYTINMFQFEFPTGTTVKSSLESYCCRMSGVR
jgi:hypothetical protein